MTVSLQLKLRLEKTARYDDLVRRFPEPPSEQDEGVKTE